MVSFFPQSQALARLLSTDWVIAAIPFVALKNLRRNCCCSIQPSVLLSRLPGWSVADLYSFVPIGSLFFPSAIKGGGMVVMI